MTVSTAYSRLQIALHWGILMLIAVNWFVSDGMEQAFDAHTNGTAYPFFPANLHVYVGLTVLALVILRLVVRIRRGAPAESLAGGPLLAKAGRIGHYALYGLMMIVPSLGAIAWFAGIDPAGGLHVLTMNLMLILIGIHAAAALFHQYVLKDHLLRRMMRAG